VAFVLFVLLLHSVGNNSLTAKLVCLCVRARACVRACVCARACMRVCVCVCVGVCGW
jgi:hypothetical protein